MNVPSYATSLRKESVKFFDSPLPARTVARMTATVAPANLAIVRADAGQAHPYSGARSSCVGSSGVAAGVAAGAGRSRNGCRSMSTRLPAGPPFLVLGKRDLLARRSDKGRA